MKKRTRKFYSNEFKQEVVNYKKNGTSCKDICKKFSIHDSMVRRWVKQDQEQHELQKQINFMNNYKSEPKCIDSHTKIANEIIDKDYKIDINIQFTPSNLVNMMIWKDQYIGILDNIFPRETVQYININNDTFNVHLTNNSIVTIK